MAQSIPEEIIRRVQDAANLVEIVSETVILRRAGRNFLGLCPFHAEKTPSFNVNEEKQVYYCHGCHTGGNVFSFLMQQGGLSFPDAVRSLASRYGIDVPEPSMSSAQRKFLSERENVYRINASAMAYYNQMLRSTQIGQKAMAYLLARGMTKKIIEGFHLGYAPDSWDGLLLHGRKAGLTVQDLLKAGLIVERKSGNGHYDRFRQRIIFPIFDSSGQVIGFGGRVMDDQLPKYLNSPETAIYSKSNSLYGIDRARQAARRSGVVYVVEGYFDVLAMHLYGIDNTVASLGTALTSEQALMLKGMVGASGKAILVYDADQAGIKAAQRCIPIFEEGLLDARILVLPQGYDPDLYLREFGPDAFFKASAGAAEMMMFLMDAMIEQFGLTLEGKVKIVAALQKPLSLVGDSVARSLYVKKLSERLDIDEQAIMEKIRQESPASTARKTDVSADRLSSLARDGQRLERQVITMLVHFPEIIPEIIGRNLMDAFEDPMLREILQLLIQQSANNQASIADIISDVKDVRYRNLLAGATVADEHWDQAGCERLLAQFEARHMRRTKAELQRRIVDAEKNKDFDLLAKLLRQKQKQVAIN